MQDNMPCQLVSWHAFYQLSCELAEKIRESGYKIDTLVAIGRGGYMPARILSDLLGIMNLITFKIEHYRGAHKSSRAIITYPLLDNTTVNRVLLVDDVSDSGDTFDIAVEHVRQVTQYKEIRSAVIHYKTVSKNKPDYYSEIVKQWRWIIYPWAVTEDLSTLIEAMIPRPVAVEEIKHQLQIRHGVRVSDYQVQRALKLIP